MASPVSTADGSDTLFSVRYGQTYHSTHGAATEARHVFLEGSGVALLLADERPSRVLEVGFGTGLNFLVTAQCALQHGTKLHYVALERDLLPADTLAALNHGDHLGVENLHRDLVTWRAMLPNVPGRYATSLNEGRDLTFLVGDATATALPSGFDAVYLDAFSPDANPELWTANFLARLFDALRPGGRLATYSAKGSVRRALAAVGFTVAKRPGPPGKRECIVATRPEPPELPGA